MADVEMSDAPTDKVVDSVAVKAADAKKKFEVKKVSLSTRNGKRMRSC